jgi:hypothetical protein
MVKNGRSRATGGLLFDGCSCHNSPNARRKATHSAKRREQAAVRREIRSALTN